jgi:hypothetical protein
MKTLFVFFISPVILLFFPAINYAQAPNLGLASGFSMFTAVGAFSNTGTTTNVTGDVGTNVGAFTAFPPGTLNGIRYVADATSAQAALDVDAAYTDVSGRTCDFALGVSLGSGQVLTPGVYCIGAAATLNGDLTLDAQGDPNAFFIFQVNGAFSTGTFSKIKLVNSATVCNVYWQVNGRFDLGDNSVFRGTLLVNGAIALLGNSSLIGRGLSRGGAISLTANTTIPCGSFLIPVTLISLKANCDEKSTIQLRWQTASEYNTTYTDIEKSTDGIHFKTIGRRIAAGNSTQTLSYFYTDQNPGQGINYYRLNQFELNGIHNYSFVVARRCPGISMGISIYPNPFTTLVNIVITNASLINRSELKIYNALGTVMIHTNLSGHLTTLATGHLPPGFYFYKISSNGKTFQSGRLLSLK